jgi:hypothetical protein
VSVVAIWHTQEDIAITTAVVSLASVSTVRKPRAAKHAIVLAVRSLQVVQRVTRALGCSCPRLSPFEAGGQELHQLLPEGLLIVVRLGMLLLLEDEGVVNGSIHQVPQQVQHGEPCAAVGERGGFEKSEGELLCMGNTCNNTPQQEGEG